MKDDAFMKHEGTRAGINDRLRGHRDRGRIRMSESCGPSGCEVSPEPILSEPGAPLRIAVIGSGGAAMAGAIKAAA